MIVWRICKTKYIHSAFSGIGAEKAGGRWNSRGNRAVYTSENLSLATLELFVRINPKIIPPDLMVVLAHLPKRFSKTCIEPLDLPSNWREFPAPARLQEIGNRWLESNSTLALIVPSAVNPVDKNFILNPDHPQMRSVKIELPERLNFDPR